MVDFATGKKPSITLPGTVEKVIKLTDPRLPEKAQISIDGGEGLDPTIRVENALIDQHGQKVALQEGAEVQVTIEAEPNGTTKKLD